MTAGIALLVGADESSAEAVARAIGYRTASLSVGVVSPLTASLTRGLQPEQLPDVVVFTAEVPFQRTIAMALEIREFRPDVDMIMLGDLDRDAMLEAMRAGIRDLAPSLTDARFLTDLRGRLDARAGSQVGDLTRVAPPPRPTMAPVDFTSRTLTVLSPKGGVGKTSLSVNLAVALAEEYPMEVVLVDLDLQFGDVSTVLDLKPTATLEDAFSAGGRDSLLLKTFLTEHSSNFYVLCGADSPAANEAVGAAQVTGLIRQLQEQFRFVVVDTAAGLDEATLAALEVSHDAVVVSTMDMACLRSVRKAIELLGELSIMPASRHVVVNFADKQNGLRIKDVEAVLGVPADVVVPRTKDIPVAANRGVPLLASTRSGPVVKAVKALSRRVVDRARAMDTKPGHKRLEVA